MKTNTVPIVFSTDDNYVPYLGVAIHSLIKHTSQNRDYEIFVFYTKLQNYSVQRLQKLSRSNIKVTCIDISEHLKAIKLYSISHLSEAAFYRILIPDVLGRFPRVIYLDSDLVLMCDIGELFDSNLEGNVLGAVRAYWSKEEESHVTEVMKLPLQSYFNSGVLVFDTARFISEKIKDKCFDLIKTGQVFACADQDVLNTVCQGMVKLLPLEWNFNQHDLKDGCLLEDEPLAYKNAAANPKIIHYSTPEKPWQHPENPRAEYFWYYARETGFYEEIIYKHCRRIFSNSHLVNKYVFPYEEVAFGSKIVLYGASTVGRAFYDKLAENRYCAVLLWVDKRYEKLRANGLPLSSPEDIRKIPYDYVVIASEHEKVAESIKNDLVTSGISEDKIIWENPTL
jgi:lipopolysaccharide biosynthesis glycosyltransferase